VFSSTLIIRAWLSCALHPHGRGRPWIMAPMAQTYAFGHRRRDLLSLTLTPALSSRLLPVSTTEDEEEKDTRFMRWVHRLYSPYFPSPCSAHAGPCCWAWGRGARPGCGQDTRC